MLLGRCDGRTGVRQPPQQNRASIAVPLGYRAAPMLAIPAYAKINLALEVLRRRNDGYHDLRSVVVAVDWHDLVILRRDPSAAGPPITVDGPTASPEIAAAGGLAARALEKALALAPSARPPLAVHIHKRIPVGAGLGGGSADAAAIVRGVAGLQSPPPPAEALLRVAAMLGSDVPVTLVGGAALVEGRGERLTPLPAPRLHLAVAIAGVSSTPATYAALVTSEHHDRGCVSRVAAALRAGRDPDPADMGSALEPAARRAGPQLAVALARLRTAVPGSAWHLTGSGGAAFAVAATAEVAARLAGAARDAGFPARACRTVTVPLVRTV